MKKIIFISVVLFCGVGGIALLVSAAKRAACEMSCGNTFKQMGLALQNYSDAFGTIPPAIIPGGDGFPKHSWRPLLLNFLAARRPVYDYDDAWDGPQNQRLLNGHVFHFEDTTEFPTKGGNCHGPIDLSIWYRCCAHHSFLNYSTNIVAVTGHDTMWPGTDARKLGNIPDGSETTILLVETNSLDIYWSEPKDIAFAEMSFKINAKDRPSISSNHPTGPAVLLADGAVYRLSPKNSASNRSGDVDLLGRRVA